MGSETFCFLTDASLREDKTSLFAQNTARLTQILTPSVKHTWAVKDFIVRKSFCGYSRHSFEKISSGKCFEKMLVWEKMRPSFSQYSCLCLFYDRRTGSPCLHFHKKGCKHSRSAKKKDRNGLAQTMTVDWSIYQRSREELAITQIPQVIWLTQIYTAKA